MRHPLLSIAFVAGFPLGLAGAQISSSTVPTKATTPAKVVPPSVPGGGAATRSLVTTFVGGSDDCSNASTANAISGNGTFAVDTTAATTGSPVGSCGFMGNDVWFYYTATLTGTATISTCGQTTLDTVIAIWADGAPAGSCPTSQITCLDDACNFQTALNFNVVAGTSYFLELGSYNASQGYNANFTINVSGPITNDSCANPINLVGDGPHAFSTIGATTGVEGQTEPLCLFFGFTDIYNDAWWTWTASTTGLYELTLCNGTSHPDTRVAVYQGTGCPAPGTAIACNDDVCGFVSALCFSATAGQAYTIQIGAFGSGQVGTGNILFTPQTGGAQPCGAQDDGSSENSVGLTAGGAIMWMVGFGSGAASSTISEVSTCYGTPNFPGWTPTGPVTIAVCTEPIEGLGARRCGRYVVPIGMHSNVL